MAKPKRQRSTGIMNKMRDKMPLIIIFLIVAFLGTIIFEWGMNYLGLRSGGENITFGKINGVEINPQEFGLEVNKRVENQRMQMNKSQLDDQSVQQIRDQVWNEYVQRILLEQECKKLGIKVTDDEITDWVYNSPETLPDALRKYFTDSTGAFRMDIYEQALKDTRPEIKDFWVSVEQYLRETLIQSKLYTVIAGAAGVSEGEVLQKYKDENIRASFDYILLDINSIVDTNLFKVTEEELRNYYDSNLDLFKQEEAVKFKYVIFSDAPTAEDSAETKRDLEDLKSDLKEAIPEDSSLIKLLNEFSQSPYSDAFRKPSDLSQSPLVANFLFDAKNGDVSDVIMDMDGYHLVKLLESKEGEDTFVKADHILVNFGTDTSAAKKKAEDIIKRARKGENFNELAFQMSDDPSAKNNKGDLGWFGKGRMVKEFEDACFKASIGDIVGPVKSQFGFHIIKINGRSKKEFKFADIKKAVVASGTTKGIVRDKAIEFYNNVDKGGNFDTLAKSLNLMVSMTPEIVKSGSIPGVQNKSIVKFGIDNNVSKVEFPLKVQGGYGVYQIVEKIPEGYKNFDSVKISMIKPKVMNEKKFTILLSNANDIRNKIQNNDLNTLSSIVPELKIEKADSVSVSKPNPSIGQDFGLDNVLYNMKPGELSAPIKGFRGYYIVKMKEISPFDQNDYNTKSIDLKKQIITSKQQNSYQEWMRIIQEKADIQDNRDKYQ